ncbi:MAG TPA: DUF4333 domain-containing protein [Actinomycetota bacterium]|nr:DUF4333 domain-containing protein [Actinomycetota bacterium]
MPVRSILLVALLAIASSACDQVLDEASLEETLARQAEDTLGSEEDLTVECPADVKVEAGGIFRCDVTSADGAVATMEVRQKDDRGGLAWRFVDASSDDVDPATGGGG